MLFWTVAAALTVATLVLIVRPLLAPRAAAADSRAGHELEVYRDQMQEVDRDLARGLISPAQAQAAKAEIGRRMLAVADTSADPASATPPRSARLLAGLLALALPLGALAVYGSLGRPTLPAMPLAERNLEKEQGGPPQNVLAAVDKLRKQLEEQPDDPQGWFILGQAYSRMGRQGEAAEALRKAAALAKDDTDIQGFYGEVLTDANGGTVTEEARLAFETILKKDAKDPRARFYLALARYQAGDLRDALDRWRALLAESAADAPWVPVVRSQIAEVAKALNLDPATVTPQPLPAAQPPAQPPAQLSAPAPGAGAAPQEMNPQDRDQMIRGMVASLASRLETDPTDLEGWLKLIRSYSVLGEKEKALEAARKAKERAPERPDILVAYASALLSALPRDQVAGNAAMPAEVTAALRQALAGEPGNRDALWLLGLDAAGTGRKDEAADLWGRLLAQFKPSDPEYPLLRARLDQLKSGG